MDFLRAIVLGIVQGATEFLPVSSSGHLILVPALFGWEDQGLAFDVGLHLGTLVALLGYFWRQWTIMIRTAFSDLGVHHLHFRAHAAPSQLLWLIVIGSLPTVIAGLLFADWIEENLRQPWLVAIMLAVVATLMLLAERFGSQGRELHGLRVPDAITIGIAQACALVPGVSRSGATITMALFRDVKRDDAARFAFLLGTPAFIGAAVLEASDLSNESSADLVELFVGLITAAVVGFAVIHFLLRYLATNTLLPFAIYRYAVAALTLIIGAFRMA